MINEDNNHESALNKNNIYSQSFITFKATLKINKMNSYVDTCNIRVCNICKLFQENELLILYVYQLLVSCVNMYNCHSIYTYTCTCIREYELKTSILG